MQFPNSFPVLSNDLSTVFNALDDFNVGMGTAPLTLVGNLNNFMLQPSQPSFIPILTQQAPMQFTHIPILCTNNMNTNKPRFIQGLQTEANNFSSGMFRVV